MLSLHAYLLLRDLAVRASSCPDAHRLYLRSLEECRDEIDEEIRHLRGDEEEEEESE